MLKMLFKKIIRIIFWLCIGLIFIGLVVFINLPNIIESQIQKRLPQFLNSSDIEFDIQKIGFSSAHISKIRISRAISINSINIDYNIQKISSIDLEKITVSGLNIQADLDENNKITIQGAGFSETLKEKNRPPDLSFLRFVPEKIVLENSQITLHALNDRILIPFDMLSFIRLKDKTITAMAAFYPFGEKINAIVDYDMNKGVESIKIEGKSFGLGHLDQFISKKTKDFKLEGSADFNLASSAPGKKWKLHFSRLGLVQPLEMSIKDLSADLLMDIKKIHAQGTFGISHSLLPETRIKYALILNPAENNFFDLKLENRQTDTWTIVYDAKKATIKQPQFSAHFFGQPLKNSGKIAFGFQKGHIHDQHRKLVLEKTKINSDVSLDFTGNGNRVKSTFAVDTDNINIQSDLMDSGFDSADISGNAAVDKNNKLSFDMIVEALDGQIKSSELKTKAFGISIKLPVQYPKVSNKKHGKYSIADIVYNNRYRFSTNGIIRQTAGKKIQASGRAGFKTVPGLKTQFKSTIGFDRGFFASVAFKTNNVDLNQTDVKKFTDQLPQNAEIDLILSARGKAAFADHQIETLMQIDIRDGNLLLPDNKFTAKGINTSIMFNDLLTLETVPGQTITIDSVKINKIKINDAKIGFSFEDAESLLFENIQFKWCNGIVSTEAVRIPQDSNIYSLVLYCDRLELTELLKQMDIFNAQGKGTLNGRIPVIYSNGNISFDNGFLFSTPGSGGKVAIKNTQKITAGISMDSPQFSQLDLAQEALKNFHYKWAKLVFNTFEDTLYVNMELDGKPAAVLPFEYKKDLGRFVRVDASSPGSHFQGIKLDVNLKLPFNEVMKFGNTLESILK